MRALWVTSHHASHGVKGPGPLALLAGAVASLRCDSVASCKGLPVLLPCAAIYTDICFYQLGTLSWLPIHAQYSAVAGAGAVVGSLVYLCGGLTMLDLCFVLNTDAQTLLPMISMTVGRSYLGMASVEVNGSMLVFAIGGQVSGKHHVLRKFPCFYASGTRGRFCHFNRLHPTGAPSSTITPVVAYGQLQSLCQPQGERIVPT